MANGGGIQVENLTKTYRGGRVRALSDASFSVSQGEAFGVIGPNGAGKTTLMGCLLGFLRPLSGRITIDGHAPDDLAVRSATGYLPERLVADRWMSGREFLLYHHELAALPAESRKQRVEEVLSLVDLDGDAPRRVLKKYSRGMLQRIGLAQAILGRPRYLFLDEPTSALDPAGMLLFRRLLIEMKQQGTTIILNSHQLREVENICDRVAFVRDGVVQSIRTVEAGAGVTHVLRIRAEGSAIGGEFNDRRLAELAQRAGAELQRCDAREASFIVGDDAVAARLLRELIGAGLPVIAVVPQESGLERLFSEPPSGGAT